ncbi:MAG: hypothetical protein MZV65_10210 [Chromatiales bacterium]|nr:hypothetical protein [Chromatiales bacterium]
MSNVLSAPPPSAPSVAPIRCWYAERLAEQRAGRGQMRQTQSRQPFIAQQCERAQQRQQGGEQQPGQQRQMKQRIEQRVGGHRIST